MPQIRPYTSQTSAQGAMPQQAAQAADVGGPGLTNVGQSIQSLGQHMGQIQRIVQQNATRAAITDVHTMLAGAKAEYTKKALKFESEANPADTNLWEQFYHGGGDVDAPTEGSMKWYLDSYREKITDGTALQAFDRGASDLIAQFGVHFAQVQSKMAGLHAQTQSRKMIDSLQAAVLADPGQYEAAIGFLNNAIDDPGSDYYGPGVNQEAREKIRQYGKEQISAWAMQGLINQNPQQALTQLTNDTHGMALHAEDVPKLITKANTKIAAQEAEARRVEADRIRQKKALYDSTEQTLMTKYALNVDNPGNHKFPPLTATEIGQAMNDDRLDGPTGRAMLSMIEADAQRPRVRRSDQGVFLKLLTDTYRNYGDKQKILDTRPYIDAAAKGQLTPTDFKFLRDEFMQARNDEGLALGQTREKIINSFMSSITKSNPLQGKLDPSGDVLFGQFWKFAVKEEERLRKDGKPPESLYDDKSPDYIGKQVSRFQVPVSESTKNISDMLKRKPSPVTPETGGVPPSKQRLPGETPEQYLNRTRP